MLAVAAFLFGVIITAVAAATVQAFVEDPIYRLLSRLSPGSIRSPIRKLNGTWASTYQYLSHGESLTGEQRMRLRQIGPYIRGSYIGGSGPHRHRVRGRIRDVYLTGFWENTARGANHHGAFQLIISPDGHEMTGRWIGFDSRHKMQSGSWKWLLESSS